MENMAQSLSARKSFGRLGWSLIATGGVSLLASLFSAVLILLDYWMVSSGGHSLFAFLDHHDIIYWLLLRLPVYAAGFFVAAAVLKKLPVSLIPKNRFSAKQLIGFTLIAIALQTPVNFLITLFMNFIYQGVNIPIPTQAPEISLSTMLDALVLAPILEEFLFRKVLLDRFRRYGEGLAILISASTFGLMHMNLQQSLTAFALGTVLAYVYLRSGNLWYCVLLHSVSNFLAAGMMTILLSRLSSKAWMLIQTQNEDLLTPEIMTELYPLAAYMLIFCCLMLIGWFILFRSRKKFWLLPTEEELTPKQAAAAVFGSAGMILYILMTSLFIVVQFLLPFFSTLN